MTSLPLPLHALLLSTVSGLSLPIGALLGIVLSPVKETAVSGMMAFGAGSLLFAVTVELYGHALREFSDQNSHISELLMTIASACVGALFFLWINRKLEDRMHGASDGGSGLQTPATTVGTLGTPLSDLDSISRQETGSFQDNPVSQCSPQTVRVTEMLTVGQEKDTHINDQEAAKAKQTALALFLGLLVDGIPEGILMGLMAAENHLSAVFIISLFVANFPEAFASSSLLRQAKMGVPAILGMWTFLCVVVGVLAGLSSWMLLVACPEYPSEDLPFITQLLIAAVEGLTGGAMIACIASVMLPEAFERSNRRGSLFMSSGFLCTCGFLLAVGLKLLEEA